MSLPIVRTRAADQTLEDVARATPVDLAVRKQQRQLIIAVVMIVLLLLTIWLVSYFTADRPKIYKNDDEHYKYGSIGSEPGGSPLNPVGGLLPPYQIFAVLPEMFPDKLPGGYASLGLIYEHGPDHKMPIGISSRRRFGVEFVGLNCAVCHTGNLRTSKEAEDQVVLGMPSHQFDLQRLFEFVLDATLNERFSPDNVASHVEKRFGKLNPFERWMLTAVLVPQVRAQSLKLQGRVGLLFTDKVTQWGPGRVDTFNPYKAIQFNWPLDQLPPEELSAACCFPSIWNQLPRKSLWLHWDGNNNSLDERNLSAGLGAGITPVTADHPAIDRVANYIQGLRPPRWDDYFPHPTDKVGIATRDAAKARGMTVYEQNCAKCHGDEPEGHPERYSGAGLGVVQPLAVIGTDPARFNSYTLPFAANQNTLFPDSKYHFSHFRKTVGYVNQPLDGIWARAPYLHNGSVPTLADLLSPEKNRPATFFSGCDIYDTKKVGFVSDLSEEQKPPRTYFKFDTSLPGNSNKGHTYGTTLTDSDKQDLIEYLKTL